MVDRYIDFVLTERLRTNCTLNILSVEVTAEFSGVFDLLRCYKSSQASSQPLKVFVHLVNIRW